MNRYPFSNNYNGWFRVANSKDIPIGAIQSVKYFGKDLIIFRGQDNNVHVLDAYCAHLGAHLGKGGKVINNMVQCPFHGWCYDGSGQCVKSPHDSTENISIRSWPTHEINQMIFVWHHSDNKPPSYEIPFIPESVSKNWNKSIDQFIIKTNLQEILENAADFFHFGFVHKNTLDLPYQNSWQANGHIFVATFHTHTRLFGERLAFLTKLIGETNLKAQIHAELHGPGLLYYSADARFQMKTLITVTPIDEEYIEMQHLVISERIKIPLINSLIHKMIIRNTHAQVIEDKPIWENKMYIPDPPLSKKDGPIKDLRQWVKQFRSD